MPSKSTKAFLITGTFNKQSMIEIEIEIKTNGNKALDKYIGLDGENNPSPANYNLYEKGDGSYKEASDSFIDGITYYQSQGNDYIIVNPQALGLYELDVDQSLDSDYYKLSLDTAFDSNKQYYVFEEEKYIFHS